MRMKLAQNLGHLQFIELYKSFHVCLISIMANLIMLSDIGKMLVFLTPFKSISQIFKISTENF